MGGSLGIWHKAAGTGSHPDKDDGIFWRQLLLDGSHEIQPEPAGSKKRLL